VVSAAVPVATSGYNDELPSIAWNGSYYFVGYQRANDATDYDAYGTLIYSTGSVYKSNIVLSSVPAGDPVEGAQTNVKVSKGSSGACIAVWQDARNSLTTGVDIYGARLTTSGTVYDTSGIPIYVSAGTQETPNVAWDGTNYVVSWRDRAILPAKLYGLRVDMYGNVVDDPCLVFSTAAPDRVSGTCSAFSGDKTVVLWAVSASSVLDIYGCTMATNGTLGADRVVSVGAQDQPTYSIAFDGTNFVLAWADKRAAKSAVYVARVTKFGEVLDPGGVLLYSSTYEQKEPAICWGGGKFLVTWTEGATSDSDVRGMRLLSDLTKLDATPLNVGTGDFGQYASSIAWNGTDFLAVWADTKQGSTNYQVDIVGARVNPTTGVITRVLTNGFDGICTETHDQFYPAVASDGSGWLVTWQDMRGANVDVYFARVDNTGAVQGTPNGALVSTAVGTKMVPSVAFDGTCYLIVWADYRTSIMYGDIYGVRMNVNGTRADANDIAISSVAGSDQSSPSVAWAGDRYYVAWQDARNTQYQIYCTRVGSDGVVAEPAGLFVSSGGQGETKPRLSSAGTNWTGMLYSKFIFPVNKLQFRAVGEQVALPLATIGQSRTVQNGQKVTVSSKVVSAGSTQLTGKLYIEEDDRTAGICVPTASSFDEAAIVTVTGILATIGGERQITNATVSVIPGTGTVPPPLGLTLATLGGSSASTYVPGVTGGLGLNNLGLLVRVCGKVMTSAGSSFTLYDGSLSENIEVICPSGVTLPTVGKMVGVTGISSCTLSGSTSTRRVLTRKQADIQTFN
jgi:hypothetical protein